MNDRLKFFCCLRHSRKSFRELSKAIAKKLLHHRTSVLVRVYELFFAVSVACTKQVYWPLVHVQVCALYRYFWHQFPYLQTHFLHGVHCARVYAICSLELGDEGAGFQLVDSGLLLLVLDVIIDIDVLSVFNLFFWRGWECVCVCVCVCVYTHKHTHTACGVLGCAPRGQDETLGGPQESRWTNSRHKYIRILWCVQSIHLDICAVRRDEILA